MHYHFLLILLLSFCTYQGSKAQRYVAKNGEHNIDLTDYIQRVRKIAGDEFTNQFLKNQTELIMRNGDVLLTEVYQGNGKASCNKKLLDLTKVGFGVLPYGNIMVAMMDLLSCKDECTYCDYRGSWKYGEIWSGMKEGQTDVSFGSLLQFHKVGLAQTKRNFHIQSRWEKDGVWRKMRPGHTCMGGETRQACTDDIKDYIDNFQFVQTDDISTTLNQISVCWGAGLGNAGNLKVYISPLVLRDCLNYLNVRSCDNDLVPNDTGGLRMDTNNGISLVRVRAYEYMWASTKSYDWDTLKHALCPTIEFHNLCQHRQIDWYAMEIAKNSRSSNCMGS